MSFEYPIFTDEAEAINASGFPTLPDGVYDFAVLESKFGYSQAGNPKIDLKIQIIHDGEQFNVFDSLLPTKRMAYRLKHFAEATGCEKEYLGGQFNEHTPKNRRGKCVIRMRAAQPKNDGSGEMWPAKNVVHDYVGTTMRETMEGSSNPFVPPEEKKEVKAEAEPFLNEDVPF